ncbi:MAG: enoyl-CoA hydratase/isomerase family protein [Thermodesulfobacteriota bacterium]|nr:enoyl-CoA hydratase/isomerase family protein [Thermodesulfobacteriota bacterium]
MEGRELLFDKKGPIGYLTFNRPDKLNAFNSVLIDLFERSLLEIEKDTSLRVIILTGAGDKAFIAGSDISDMKTRTGPSSWVISRTRQAFFRLLENLPQISIAAVNGYAFGGGVEIAMACTFRIASEKARFGQTEANFNLIPGGGGTQRLCRLVGETHSIEMILTGRILKAPEALKMGLVNRVVPHNDLMKECEDMARKLIQLEHYPVKIVRELIESAVAMDDTRLLRQTATNFGLVAASQSVTHQ